jgi:hypothetical protein
MGWEVVFLCEKDREERGCESVIGSYICRTGTGDRRVLLVCIVAERGFQGKRKTVTVAFSGKESGSGHSGMVCTSATVGWNYRRTVMLA